MEYGQDCALQGAPGVSPYLEGIATIADEAERAATYIEGFINRCRGGGNVQSGTGPTPVPSGHFGQLSRLREAVSQIDKLARELQTIG